MSILALLFFSVVARWNNRAFQFCLLDTIVLSLNIAFAAIPKEIESGE